MIKLLFIFLLWVPYSPLSQAGNMEVVVLTDTCIKPLYEYHYLTCGEIVFCVNNIKHVIPKNFETDLASIPRIGWAVMSPAHSSSFRAAIIHDWLYHNPCNFSRMQADMIFFQLTLHDGLPLFRSYLLYYSVRLFGWPHYNTGVCHGRRRNLDKEVRGIIS